MFFLRFSSSSYCNFKFFSMFSSSGAERRVDQRCIRLRQRSASLFNTRTFQDMMLTYNNIKKRFPLKGCRLPSWWSQIIANVFSAKKSFCQFPLSLTHFLSFPFSWMKHFIHKILGWMTSERGQFSNIQKSSNRNPNGMA